MDGFVSWFQKLDWSKLLTMLVSAVACLVCIVFHELCHGLAADWLGDDTAKREGRLTLNPLKHIDIIGLVMLFALHFGWAKPVSVDARRFRHPKLGMALTALAGPAGNLLLAVLLTPVYAGVVGWYQVSGGRTVYYLAVSLLTTISLSIGLMVFNLFPIPPLDGAKIFFAILPSKLYFGWMRYERFGMIVLVVLLYSGVLDTPLVFLRDGLLDGLMAVFGMPVLRLVTGRMQ